MTQSIKRYGHRSHVGGIRRSKNLINNNIDRWSNELRHWFKKYKNAK